MTDSPSITCDDCRERLEEFALSELDAPTGALVADHLAQGCDSCNRRLAEIVAGLAAVSHSLPLQHPPLRIERELMQRIARQQPLDRQIAPLPKSSATRKSFASGLIGASIALAACLLVVAAWTAWQGGSIAVRPTQAVEEADYWAHLRRRMDQADKSQQFSAVPRLQFADLRSRVLEKPIHGYIVADQVATQWHVYVFNLPALSNDRLYQMWLVTADSQHIPVGTIDIDATGTASRVVNVPSDVATIKGVAISDEPAAGSDQPSGENFFRADLP